MASTLTSSIAASIANSKVKLKEIQDEIDALKVEYAENKVLIKNKVKGKIRSSQSRNKKIRERIEHLHITRQPYYNGGIW
jgi:hypothetical protein